jgi:hypothetical protein
MSAEKLRGAQHFFEAPITNIFIQNRVGIKKPTKKTPKFPPKKPTKNGFLGFLWVFLNF